MPRISVPLPSHFSFSTKIPIRITDLNYGNHVGNDTILSLIHEARMQFLASHGYSEMNVESVGLIMSDAAIEFKTELFYGEALEVQVQACAFNRVGFDICYKLLKDETVVAIAKTGMVCFDYSKRKVVSLPEKAKAQLGL